MHTLDEILTAFANDELTDAMRYDACVMAGIPTDAADFIVEWYPGFADNYAILAISGYGRYNPLTFEVMSEDILDGFLYFYDVSEDEYTERFGFIIRDAAFEGVLVAGE